MAVRISAQRTSTVVLAASSSTASAATAPSSVTTYARATHLLMASVAQKMEVSAALMAAVAATVSAPSLRRPAVSASEDTALVPGAGRQEKVKAVKLTCQWDASVVAAPAATTAAVAQTARAGCRPTTVARGASKVRPARTCRVLSVSQTHRHTRTTSSCAWLMHVTPMIESLSALPPILDQSGLLLLVHMGHGFCLPALNVLASLLARTQHCMSCHVVCKT